MTNSKVEAPKSHARDGSTHRFATGDRLFATLIVLSIVGVAITDFSQRYALWYWLAMVPLFGGASIWAHWSRARRQGHSVFAILGKQILHWFALLLAVLLIYFLQRTGRMNNDDAGLVALLALSLTTFLAGVHFDWRLRVLGILLGVAAASAAFIEEFFWLLAVVMVLAGVVALFWQKRAA